MILIVHFSTNLIEKDFHNYSVNLYIIRITTSLLQKNTYPDTPYKNENI